ncbi:RDD family protein [Nocardioides zeae]|uniref:RDD family protein n=1 Tax=Nocardioides imazamoxiresistens TaxID=3231893 RepID=A0ABU3PTR6_9ACTN|nr:RDD family protein [Nocardioides zeae]MDT9592622.1 RDD family protein [Nocardioides zeae]
MSTTINEQASWARRAGALLIDWFASTLVVIVFIGPGDYYSAGGGPALWTSIVFVLESTIFTTVAGGSFGKLATRLRVVRVDGGGWSGGGVDPIRSFARSVLIMLVIPPLVFRPDGRGLHDLAVGTATVPLSALR